jgi:hypothetical protein
MKSRIKFVRRIQVVKDQAEPGLLAIKAQGIADLKMPLNPVLVPRDYPEDPGDGIYELDFRLDESGQEFTGVELEVEVVVRLKNLPEWVKGVKINADENSDIELL